MNMMQFNSQVLSDQLGRQIPDILVTICKNDLAGLPPSDIARLIGVTEAEVTESQQLQDYKDIRLLMGARFADDLVERDFSWDSIESEATRKLYSEVKKTRDPEFMLKVAAIANKAQRRVNSGTSKALDQNQANPVVPLRLTQRFIEQLNSNGDLTRITERQISVLDGSARNPSFSKIDEALGVNAKKVEPVGRKGDDLDWDDLDKLSLPK